MRLKLASRKSDLARWQAVKVGEALARTRTKPEIEYLFKSSFGDQNLDIPLAGMGARGVFTEDFYKDLTEGRCDLVVHSWKDLPVEERATTTIAMTLPRADVRDILMIPEGVWQKALKAGRLTVLTSSPRRVYNLGPALPALLPGHPDVEFKNVRGNVATRLRKMTEENAGLILAKAGLDRLLEAEGQGFTTPEDSIRALTKDCRFVVLPVSLNPPAPAQGALAVEIARTHTAILEMSRELNDTTTYQAVNEERQVLQKYGGGCHQKIGVARLPRAYGTVQALRGLTEAGEVLNEWRIENSTPWSKASGAESIFPRKPEENSWFDREDLPAPILDGPAYLVARAEAVPSDIQFKETQVIWTAGVKSWIRLAALGHFVNGCQDNLGESEPTALEFLRGSLGWQKLSHDQAPGENVVATYRLKDKTSIPDLKGRTHFFWMSATSFAAARRAYPREIAEGHHACGPGNTYEFLRAQSLINPVKIMLGLEQFLHETLP